jgi:hypothetical protein
MEEKMNVIHDKEHSCSGGCCGCGMHGGHMGMMMHGGKYYILRKLVMLIAILVIFWFGTKLGELETLMRYAHEGTAVHGLMMPYYDNTTGSAGLNTTYNNMMGGSTVTPAHPITPTTPTN